jgi:Sulfotransferase family
MSISTEVSAQVDDASTSSPFFIVGSPRSGSTLLRMMLVSHSRLTVPPETYFLIPLVKRFRIDRPLTPVELESAVSMMTGSSNPRAAMADKRQRRISDGELALLRRFWPDLKFGAQDFQRKVYRLTQPYLRDVVEVVYRRNMEAEGKVRWGNKTPAYIEILPELARMYPNSRFIHVIRDGRDVAKSLQATGWFGRWLHDNATVWTKALEYQSRWSQSGFRDRILEVRYESLVLDTEATLREICRFLGEDFEPQMLAWESKVDEQIPARQSGYHPKLKLRIGSEGIARWKLAMSAREAFVCEAFMGLHLTRLRYERRYGSRLWAPAFALTRGYCRTVLPVIQFHIRAVRYLRKRLRMRFGVNIR